MKSEEIENTNIFLFSPIEFRLISNLMTRTHTTIFDLEKLLNTRSELFSSALQALIERHYIETKDETLDQESSLNYCVTVEGKQAFLEQVSYLEKMITACD